MNDTPTPKDDGPHPATLILVTVILGAVLLLAHRICATVVAVKQLETGRTLEAPHRP